MDYKADYSFKWRYWLSRIINDNFTIFNEFVIGHDFMVLMIYMIDIY